ncbi:hypothetical protein ACX3SV_05470 [Hafnia paralvei]
MAFYIAIDMIEESDVDVIYKYCGNNVDWGFFSIEKVNFHLNIIKLANNDDKKNYLYRALSAVKKSFEREGEYPQQTCYAA